MTAQPTLVLGAGRTAPTRVRMYRLTRVGPAGRRDDGAPPLEVTQTLLRIGAHAQNDLVLDAEGVSRIHCEIAADEHGFRLRDLGSTNGTHVDGMRAQDVYLRPGARLTIGRAELLFEPLAAEATVPLAEGDRFGPLVGRSAMMRELFHVLGRVAPTETTVLIQGESGTGKELVAEALHGASPRKGGPFVVFDCSAVSGALLESELFGHEKGAFTGAQGAREGCLEAADGGTLFLDEIGELPLELQPKLLRAVERRELRRVGGTTTRKVDVRIVAATNRDLAAEVNRGTFRDDLYYRLAVVRVRAPALRERAEDIPLLVEHFLRTILRDEGDVREALASLAPEAWRRLAEQPWRGNVRELRNLVERKLALGDDEAAFEMGLRNPADGVGAPAGAPRAQVTDGALFDPSRPMIEQREALLARFERGYLTALLAAHDGNFSRAAAAAGIDRMYFKRLFKKYEG